MACIPPNPRRVEYIDHIHGPLDGPLYMGHIYTNTLVFCMQVFCSYFFFEYMQESCVSLH